MKDDIIKDVSHELKSPLAQLRLALEMWLKWSVQEGEKVRIDQDGEDRFIGIIRDNITRINDTVESILTLADIDSGNLDFKKELLPLGVLINQITAGQKLIAEKKKLILTSVFQENLPDVLIDKTQVAGVLSNLIDNAIKYTESGEIKISAVRRNNDIEVAIKDTGIGIGLPESSQNQIFERFYQERTNSQGVGVGLSICEKIIKAHRGKIWVESEGKGKGATFKFTLPIPLPSI
jgi:signal transduction histidine kinase